MTSSPIFQRYEALAAEADRAFGRMQEEYGTLVRCRQGCADCCHALFGLFLVEAAYLQERFRGLARKDRREILLRSRRAARKIGRMQEKWRARKGNSRGESGDLERERVRCPLLNDDLECDLYPFRPITCRVYGIPTVIHGRGHVCGMSGFGRGGSYPSFDMDRVQRELHFLSREMLTETPEGDPGKASLLVSVSGALETTPRDLITGSFGSPRKVP